MEGRDCGLGGRGARERACAQKEEGEGEEGRHAEGSAAEFSGPKEVCQGLRVMELGVPPPTPPPPPSPLLVRAGKPAVPRRIYRQSSLKKPISRTDVFSSVMGGHLNIINK